MRALLLSGAFSGAFTLLMTPLFIRLFHRLQWGQFIREDGPKSHHVKHGTATMGGIVIIIGTVVGYFLGMLFGNRAIAPSALLVLFMMVGLRTRRLRRRLPEDPQPAQPRPRRLGEDRRPGHRRRGLRGDRDHGPRLQRAHPASTSISFIRDLPFDFASLGWIGIGLFVLWICIIVTSTSNGVNVADGLDGLATGSSILAIGSYVIIGFWQSNQWCFDQHLNPEVVDKCYQVSDPFDLAIIAAAVSGALVGFLWWNTSPAQIFMGDTGSLGLGGALAALAILTRTELLVILIGGLFVIVTGSVILSGSTSS